MTDTFASLKKSNSSELKRLSEEANKLNSKKYDGDDDRFWKPTVDAAGNGQAIIRFLPAPPGEDVPFVRYWDHGFQGPGGWYIEKSLTTIGKDDPMSDYNSKLWNTGIESNKEIVRRQKRRLHYVSNIYVVDDKANPENNGKVFLYEYGKKIFDKVNDLMNPEFDDVEAVNPFDLWSGADFRLRIRKVEGYRNYDKSEFDDPSPLLGGDDEKLEAIWKSEHGLKEFIDPANFKSYAELEARMNRVLGLDGGTIQQSTAESIPDSDDEEAPWSPPSNDNNSETSDDDDLEFFKSLAN